jgi:hypothetical protein
MAVELDGGGKIVATNRTAFGVFKLLHNILSIEKLSKFKREYTLNVLVTRVGFLGKRLED